MMMGSSILSRGANLIRRAGSIVLLCLLCLQVFAAVIHAHPWEDAPLPSSSAVTDARSQPFDLSQVCTLCIFLQIGFLASLAFVVSIFWQHRGNQPDREWSFVAIPVPSHTSRGPPSYSF